MVSIYSIHYNKLEFLELQYQQILKYCNDELNYIVVNNGINTEISKKITDFCVKYKLLEILTPNLENENRANMSSTDHIIATDFIYKNHISKDLNEFRILIDSDIIPYKEFSFISIIEDNEILALNLGGYASSFIIMFNKNVELSEFNIIDGFQGGDSGMGTRQLVEKYKTKWIKHTCPIKELEVKYLFNKYNNTLFCENNFWFQFIDDCFIHYYRGSNWDGSSSEKKWIFFTHFLNNVDLYNLKLDENICYETAHIDEWLYKDKYKVLL
jgi:hypothetical protein